jgi:hypothetical protein
MVTPYINDAISAAESQGIHFDRSTTYLYQAEILFELVHGVAELDVGGFRLYRVPPVTTTTTTTTTTTVPSWSPRFWRFFAVKLGLDYTNIVMILIIMILVVIAIGILMFFARKS